ncbi:MAG TPA: hypothetical protein VLM40_06265, partial [Gemmata sp.]|nr:hypothetical protein [Gemmata sp.]
MPTLPAGLHSPVEKVAPPLREHSRKPYPDRQTFPHLAPSRIEHYPMANPETSMGENDLGAIQKLKGAFDSIKHQL